MWSIWGKPRERFSIEELKHLNDVLSKHASITESNKDVVVETLRSIAELMIWGDQHEPAFFEFFVHHGVFSQFLRILALAQKAPDSCSGVSVQLLQTLNLMMQNIRSESAIHYLFSKDFVNNVISFQHDFGDEELLAYYISFLKTISMKLDERTVSYFIIQKEGGSLSFPLYIEAIRFFHHEESMVRIAVRTVTLKVYNVQDARVRSFILSPSAIRYFEDLAIFVRQQSFTLGRLVANAAKNFGSVVDIGRVEGSIAEIGDLLYYCNDIMGAGIPSLADVVSDHLLSTLVFPILLASLAPEEEGEGADVNAKRLSPLVALYLISRLFHVVTFGPFLDTALSAIAASLSSDGTGMVTPSSVTSQLSAMWKESWRRGNRPDERLEENALGRREGEGEEEEELIPKPKIFVAERGERDLQRVSSQKKEQGKSEEDSGEVRPSPRDVSWRPPPLEVGDQGGVEMADRSTKGRNSRGEEGGVGRGTEESREQRTREADRRDNEGAGSSSRKMSSESITLDLDPTASAWEMIVAYLLCKNERWVLASLCVICSLLHNPAVNANLLSSLGILPRRRKRSRKRSSFPSVPEHLPQPGFPKARLPESEAHAEADQQPDSHSSLRSAAGVETADKPRPSGQDPAAVMLDRKEGGSRGGYAGLVGRLDHASCRSCGREFSGDDPSAGVANEVDEAVGRTRESSGGEKEEKEVVEGRSGGRGSKEGEGEGGGEARACNGEARTTDGLGWAGTGMCLHCRDGEGHNLPDEAEEDEEEDNKMRPQVIDTLFVLLCRRPPPCPEALWHAGWILRQLLLLQPSHPTLSQSPAVEEAGGQLFAPSPRVSSVAPAFPTAPSLASAVAAPEFTSSRQRMLEDAYQAARDDLIAEMSDCWSDVLPAYVAAEWNACRRALVTPALARDSSLVLMPNAAPLLAAGDTSSYAYGERMGTIVKVYVALFQMQSHLLGLPLPDTPPVDLPPPISSISLLRPTTHHITFSHHTMLRGHGRLWVDASTVQEGELVEFKNAATSMACKVAFERGKEKKVRLMLASHGTTGYLVIAEPIGAGQLDANQGIVRVVAPLAGANPSSDQKHRKWLHLRIRSPQAPPHDAGTLNSLSSTSAIARARGWDTAGSKNSVPKRLADGRWTLAFPDDASCRFARRAVWEETCIQSNAVREALEPLVGSVAPFELRDDG